MMKSLVTLGIGMVASSILVPIGGASATEIQLPLPDVTVTAPGPTTTPPYLRDPGSSMGRNPYHGRFRVEEENFKRVPCTDSRVSATAGGTCLEGYKLTMGSVTCDGSLDVVMIENARLSIEADILIFDPYKVTGAGHTSPHCYVRGYLDYNVDDFQDMNQVTRRGTNFRNLVGVGEDKAVEFTSDNHNCKAIRHTGPRWQGGYLYIGHISICRKDTAQVQAEDISYVFNTLRIRTYDPVGNLRGPEANNTAAPLPSDPNVELRPR
jgi:hypothetical protein